ncbi:MAG: phosphopantetheine-binding protein [Candidatus Eremiobacteraeota bacterium]|nr:phosphopantetheine-binding protein [Candidatus Eremiobacteraeota bacterium]
MDIQESVLTYFRQNGSIDLKGATELEKLKCNYLEEGVVDSFGIVNMIMTFEEQFNIHFTPEDMQSDDFQTPGGLIKLIESHIQKSENHS